MTNKIELNDEELRLTAGGNGGGTFQEGQIVVANYYTGEKVVIIFYKSSMVTTI